MEVKVYQKTLYIPSGSGLILMVLKHQVFYFDNKKIDNNLFGMIFQEFNLVNNLSE